LRYPQAANPDERRRRFEAVYAANFGPMLGYVLRRTENGDDAADVVAETFLTAWRRLDDVPPGDRARLWLYGVARRMLANHYRGERRKSELADRLRGDLAITCLDQESTGSLADLAAAFASLAGTDRELLSLVAWEGLDHGEIASVLGCSRNAVRIRLHRARSRFAAALGREHLEPRPTLTREQCELRPALTREQCEPRPALAPIPSGETP
jgi:RNA polymerase sigma-70 factor (ECF subfamily)